MSWSDHIDTLCKKVSQRLGVLRRVKYLLPLHGRLTLYNSLILPLFDYADTVWGDKNNEVLMHNLQVLQNNAARIILDLPNYFSGTQAFARLNWIHLAKRRRQHRCTAVYKCVNKLTNFSFDLVRNMEIHSHNGDNKTCISLEYVPTGESNVLFIIRSTIGTFLT